MAFIGREKELSQLKWLLEKKSASLVTIKGRRRVGKSRLVTEFAKNLPFIKISGIAPTKNTTAQSQRDEFAEQLAIQTRSLNTTANSWNILFHQLAEKTQHGRHVILLDEISWMGSKDDTFLGKLKNAWDMLLSNNPELILILCGSVSTWIENEIINCTLFLGRPALNITLKALSVDLANQFWASNSEQVSPYNKLKLLSITGGIPRYLELLNTSKPAEENIAQLFFSSNSPLSNEFNLIFSDIFGRRSAHYVEIIKALTDGSKTQKQLIEILNRKTSGEISVYLNDLVDSGFIARDFTWSFTTRKRLKLSRYRIQDNYVRFYLKCIAPNLNLFDVSAARSLNSIPGWSTTLGLQFECLVQNNTQQIFKTLNLKPDDVIQVGPYFQTQTQRKQACQIDLLIQTRYNTLLACEIKFKQQEIKKEIVQELKDKISKLVIPKGFSCFPVLIHVNGVQDEVLQQEYFSHIIDFGELLA